jgi:hypothetical protein
VTTLGDGDDAHALGQVLHHRPHREQGVAQAVQQDERDPGGVAGLEDVEFDAGGKRQAGAHEGGL